MMSYTTSWDTIHLSDLVLEEPVLPSESGRRINPDNVPSSGLVIYVNPYTGMAVGDKVEANFGAHITQKQIVTQQQLLTFIAPKSEVDRQHNNFTAASYVVTRASGSRTGSPLLGLRVTREPDSSLLKPVIPLAPGDILTPEIVPGSGLLIQLTPYTGMATRDKVKLIFGTYTQEQVVTQNQQLTFNVPKAEVDRRVGTTIPVAYTVARASGGQISSHSILLRINKLKSTRFDGTAAVTPNNGIHCSSLPISNPPANT